MKKVLFLLLIIVWATSCNKEKISPNENIDVEETIAEEIETETFIEEELLWELNKY